MSQYKCIECNIEYKTNCGLWKHNKNKHTVLKKTENNNCKYCNKELGNRHSRWRHENKTCKKKSINEIIAPVQNTNIQTQNIDTLNNSTQNIGTLNNGTINITVNNYNEDNIKYISDKFMTNILNKLSKTDDKSLKEGIPHLIENIKFNPSHKENNNVKITNLKSKIAKRFIDNKWEHIEKEAMIKDMHNTAITIVQNWINENKDIITDKMINKFKDYKNISEEYKKKVIRQEINLLGYTYFKNNMENDLDI